MNALCACLNTRPAHGASLLITIDEIFREIDKVTHDDIIKVANKYIRDEYMTLTAIGDITEKELPKV